MASRYIDDSLETLTREMRAMGADVVVQYEFCSLDDVADLSAEYADPFHIVAERERELGSPLALSDPEPDNH